MPLALSQVRVDSLLGVSCPECQVRVDQGKSPGCGLTQGSNFTTATTANAVTSSAFAVMPFKFGL